MTMFIMFPWAATRLWGARWNRMSFGSLAFHANLDATGLKRRWALLYFLPIALFIAIGGMAAVAGLGSAASGASRNQASIMAILITIVVLFYLAIPLATLHWFAKFYRKAAAATTLGELEFGFEASTWAWLKLFLGNLALAVVTLGLGIAYWGYRNWSFIVRHARLYGEIDVGELTQSTTRAPKEAEGFADAFDMGAI